MREKGIEERRREQKRREEDEKASKKRNEKSNFAVSVLFSISFDGEDTTA